MRILFTIAGRAGSKGVKNKNIRPFLGYPLPHFTIAAIELFLDANPDIEADVVLNTDSEALISIFLDYKPKFKPYVIHRQEKLSGDLVPKMAVISNCMEVMQTRHAKSYDVIIDLDLTSPLRTVGDIENLIEEYITGSYDVVFSVTPARRNPYFNMVKRVENEYQRVLYSDFTTRQEAPEIYDMNASLYAYSPLFLASNSNIFDGICGVIVMEDTGILDIDNEGDFELMEAIAKYMFMKNIDMKKIWDDVQKI